MQNFDNVKNPLPLVLSMIADASNSDVFLQIINGSGIQIDLNLSRNEDFSHTTRIRAYKPRVSEVLKEAENNDALITINLLIGNFIERFPDKKDTIDSKLKMIGWEFSENTLQPVSEDVIELFFSPGLRHSAYTKIRDILITAKASIWIIDHYIDSTIFEILKPLETMNTYEVRILTKIGNSDFDHENSLFHSQYNHVTVIRKHNTDFHDRFLIVDQDTVYNLGASIKDAGKRFFVINKIENANIRATIKQEFKSRW